MNRTRALVKLAAIVVMTAALVIPRFAIMVFAPIAPRLERRMRRPLVRLWGKLSARLMGMQIRIVGTLPEPPFFLVSNHVSYVDSFLMVGLTGGAFVAREDVRRWPGANLVALAGNTLFIDRSNIRDTKRVGELIRRELSLGTGIIVYPESRTSAGHEVRPFKSALLEPAVEMGIPVHYCAIHYETLPGEPPAPDVVCWHTKIGFMAHALRLLALKGFTATVTCGPAPIVAPDRKELAQALHEAVVSRFTPM
jgi:1-acyl-sn-glycerol-3-phosphate acyltransferase